MRDSHVIKVLQVTDTLSMGGAETWLMEVLRLWSRRGTAQMDFVLTSGNRGLFDEEAEQLGAKLHYLQFGRRTLPAFVSGFRRLLREESYDAIHDHQAYASGWHYLVGGSALPSVRVTHVHNPSYQILNDYGVSPSRRAVARLGKHLIAQYATHIAGTSRQILTEYGFDAPMFDRIPRAALHCGFDPSRFLGNRNAARTALCKEFGWPVDAKIILFAGRIDQSPDLGHPQNHKNSGFAVEVAIAAFQRDAAMRALFAGKQSPACAVLEQRIAAAGGQGKIVFAGIRNDIERLMLGSDVLLFPSRGEGLGMVAVEAQAAGLPVLATTSVPRECVVVPELVRFREIASGPAEWVLDLLHLADRPRDGAAANRQVAASAFAIENSAHALAMLYGQGLLAASPETGHDKDGFAYSQDHD